MVTGPFAGFPKFIQVACEVTQLEGHGEVALGHLWFSMIVQKERETKGVKIDQPRQKQFEILANTPLSEQP